MGRNKAIDAVAAAGGGTLIFPAGTYLSFTIRLRSNIQIYLSAGCIIQAADSPKPNETDGGRVHGFAVARGTEGAHVVGCGGFMLPGLRGGAGGGCG